MELWQQLAPKTQLAIVGLTLTVAKDVYNYNRDRAAAKAKNEPSMPFNWGMALPMWWIGFMGGLGLGTAGEVAANAVQG